MKITEEKHTLRELHDWFFKQKCLVNDLPFQRNSGVWSVANKSNLIWSVMANSFIPQIILYREQKKGKSKKVIYHIADGLQRLTNLFGFVNMDYKLHSTTPEIEVDGTIYDLADMGFDDLSEECQEALLSHEFSIVCVEDCSYEELEHLFFSINSGVPLSTIQKSKPKLGTGLMGYLNELLLKDFFTKGINITEAQSKREDDLCLLLQNMLLLDDMYYGIGYKSISTAVCLGYAEDIRNKYSDEQKEALTTQIDYLSEVFANKHKFLRKTNAPIVMICAHIALKESIKPDDFRSFINVFANTCNEEYDEACGSGNVKASKVKTRLRVMFMEMCKYFQMHPKSMVPPYEDCDVDADWLYDEEGYDDAEDGVSEEFTGAEGDAEQGISVSVEIDEETQNAIASLREQYELGNIHVEDAVSEETPVDEEMVSSEEVVSGDSESQAEVAEDVSILTGVDADAESESAEETSSIDENSEDNTDSFSSDATEAVTAENNNESEESGDELSA